MSRPASLLARTNMILGLSSLCIVAIAMTALYVFVIQPIGEQSAEDEAALMLLSLQTWVELPPESRTYFELEMAQTHDLILSAEVRDLAAAPTIDPYAALLAIKLGELLDSTIDLRRSDDLYWANVDMSGYALQLGFSAERRNIQPLLVAIIVSGLGVAVVIAASLFLVRRIASPLVQAAQRAESFRGAQDFEPLPERGPRELVSLAQSFNTMARDISSLMANRTTLLAGVSHDLRTPITRMRLVVALLAEESADTVDPELIARLERNLEAMDELISDALEFARGAQEPQDLVDLAALLRAQLNGMEPSVTLQVIQAPAQELRLAPGALGRVIANLVDNAVHHGGAPVVVELERQQIRVLDTGPGVPAELREQVFEPFYRIDHSRSAATGGSGLGLAIVKQLCQAHGWRVAITECHPQGACVILDLGVARTVATSPA